MRHPSDRRHPTLHCIAIVLCLAIGGVAEAADVPAARALGPLPEGDAGIAAAYPGDVGIGSAPGVVFSDDFEATATVAALGTKWNAGVMHQVRIAQESANVHAGGRALEFTAPQQAAEISNQVMRTLSPKLDRIFMRYYTRFDPGFAVVGSSHNGSSISGGYYDASGNASPGVPANGSNKVFVSVEHGRDAASEPMPGRLNAYVYWPRQGDVWGDHFYPTGEVTPFSSTRSGAATFGAGFVGRPDVVPPLGTWFCQEVMVALNTVGSADGRIAVWMDGRLVADWPNLRFRDIGTLLLDRIGLDLHVRSNTIRANRKWYDDVVVATRYIGPMSTGAVNRAPVAQVQSVSLARDTAKAIVLVATDADAGDTRTYAIVTAPAHGTLTGAAPNLTYTPARGYAGADAFSFRATDNRGAVSNTATVSITVTAATTTGSSIRPASATEAASVSAGGGAGGSQCGLGVGLAGILGMWLMGRLRGRA